MKRRHTLGFTITEALVTVLILGFFILVLFMVVVWGFKTFAISVSRADVTTEARRIALFVEQELRGSAYFSVATESQMLGAERRDALCFVSRKDWANNAYDVTEAKPNFDRYFLYYATPEAPTGKLMRLEIIPATPEDVGRFPFRPFLVNPSSFQLQDPTGNFPPTVSSARVLATSVKQFEVEKTFGTQEVDIKLLLREDGIAARRPDGSRLGGTFELHYRVRPQNTN